MKKDEEMILRDTVIEVDLDRIAGNMRAIKAMVGEKTAVAGVVKADGYGHGAVGIAKTLMENAQPCWRLQRFRRRLNSKRHTRIIRF